MYLTVQTTITWASANDQQANSLFNSTRANQLSIMVANNETDGVVLKSNTANSGSIKFIDTTSAQTWINFVETLATEYGKTIISTAITPL